MVHAGLPAPVIMKISGHTQMSTFQRYVNPDGTAVQEIAQRLADYNNLKKADETALAGEYVN